jgi:hypothetical protein
VDVLPHTRLAGCRPVMPRFLHIGTLGFAGQKCFFKTTSQTELRTRDKDAGWAATLFSANNFAASSGVMSGSASTQPIRASRCSAALSPRLRRTRAGNPRRELDRKTRADLEPLRRRPTRLASIDLRLNACAQFYRMWFPHACRPPPSQHLESDVRPLGNSSRFRFQARCSNGISNAKLEQMAAARSGKNDGVAPNPADLTGAQVTGTLRLAARWRGGRQRQHRLADHLACTSKKPHVPAPIRPDLMNSICDRPLGGARPRCRP